MKVVVSLNYFIYSYSYMYFGMYPSCTPQQNNVILLLITFQQTVIFCCFFLEVC